jgi:two-component system, NtrC family, sensor kinase
MALFPWDKRFCVGIMEVDDQHEKLVGMVNRLDEAVSAGRDEKVIGQILKEALDYTQYHFSTEERLMEKAGLTGEHYRRHKIEHIDFVKTVVAEVGALRERHESVSQSLLQYLIKWLVDHILGSDREMARLLLDPPVVGTWNKDAIERDRDLERAEQKLLAALNESEWRFRVIADSAPVLIWMCGADGRRGFFNLRWSEFTGMAREFLDTQWADSVHPDDRIAVLDRYRRESAGPSTVEYRLRRADGAYRWMLESVVVRRSERGEYDGCVGSCVDITDLKLHEQTLERQVAERTAELRETNQRMEKEKAEQFALIQRLKDTQAQLLQSEKMASIGQLAAGVAHEINNPVGYVKSNLSALGGYVNDLLRLVDTFGTDAATAAKLRTELDYEFLRDDVKKLLGESNEGVDRVQHIVQDLKDFSHVDEAEWQTADLSRGLDSTLNLVWNELKYKAEIVKEYGDLPPVECLSRQLNQVFMNILVNAAQAIPQRGTITLRTRRDGDWAVVEIADNGVGISADRLNRIFEPFYTTKPVGKGTGLGLSIAYGIVQKHHGRIEVESVVGKGSTFRVCLPTARADEAA